jgi:hypothetical protein
MHVYVCLRYVLFTRAMLIIPLVHCLQTQFANILHYLQTGNIGYWMNL